MIKLCGFAMSNYYNKVKFVLLEKGIPFEEVWLTPAQDEATLCRTALGKVPFIETPQGTLTESQVIVDYLEAVYPAHPLLPSDPFAAAKQRELITYIELHLELLARELYGQAFFGTEGHEHTRKRIQKKLPRHVQGFLRIATFGPYLGGETFGLADIVASIHFPLIGLATKAVLAPTCCSIRVWTGNPTPNLSANVRRRKRWRLTGRRWWRKTKKPRVECCGFGVARGQIALVQKPRRCTIRWRCCRAGRGDQAAAQISLRF